MWNAVMNPIPCVPTEFMDCLLLIDKARGQDKTKNLKFILVFIMNRESER